MKTKLGYLFLLLICAMIQLTGIAQDQEWPGIRDSIYSDILKENRRIQIILPGDYKSNPQEKFEVLFLFDVGNQFIFQEPPKNCRSFQP
ncbi:MAG: hypothetical protein WD824_18585 [Cyclobacteriaceae bacterium]